jgi:uncharacterized protein
MSRVPIYLDPWRAAEQSRRLEGVLPLRGLPRIADILVCLDGDAHFELEFSHDVKRRPCVRGRVRSVLRLECQRCLEPVDIVVDAAVMLGLVRGNEEAARLPEEYDPLVVVEDRVYPADLIEDEIILALPQTPMHGSDHACGRSVVSTHGGAESAEASHAREADNPFRVLEGLKKTLQ